MFGYLPKEETWRDILLRITGHPSLIRRVQAPIIMRLLAPSKKDVILDVGCGSGFFTYELSKRSRLSIGLDWNLNKDASRSISRRTNLVYVKGDAQKLPLASKRFDKLLLSSVMQMVENDKVLLRECYRVLQDSGFLILSVPTKYLYFKKLNEQKEFLRKKFGSKGRAYYDVLALFELLHNEGFEVLDYENTPKKSVL